MRCRLDYRASEFAWRQKIVISRAIGVFALMLMAGAASAAELDRMFYTPAQRATLDNARKQNIRAEISSDNEQQTAAAPVPQNVSVNGVIRRSDGKNTIWLNNRVISEQQKSGVNASVGKNDNRVRLSMPESGRGVDLKVGQTVEIVSGTVAESYLRRPAPKPEAKAASAGENTGSDVPKVTPAQTREAVKSEPIAPTRPTRAVDRDVRDDSRPNNGADAK